MGNLILALITAGLLAFIYRNAKRQDPSKQLNQNIMNEIIYYITNESREVKPFVPPTFQQMKRYVMRYKHIPVVFYTYGYGSR